MNKNDNIFEGLLSLSSSTMTQNARREFFQDWVPTIYPWRPNDMKLWTETEWESTKTFKVFFDREPLEGEDVYGLNRAGGILNFVFGMSVPPKNIFQEEWDCLEKAVDLMREKDISISFGLEMTLGQIKAANLI
uniref:Uncharacterized protein n=1 Tax=Marseillevirus LCMAC101 TaxID=2506602 RepID=A0A481YRD2_9VIRU|nr:MAG: hypothetical protein LCMAC101_00640 [Marseillevirus LCMAC101]